MPRILHFADAHIDLANYGPHDASTGLPVRIMDFLQSLDEIIDAAVREKVDLVIFAGDAYKDRSPAPTFQREWGRRIMRLSRAGIPTLLLIGNHDLSPAVGRAHALSEFATLDVPHVLTLSEPCFLSARELSELGPEGTELDLQVLALPWISRSQINRTLEDVPRNSGTLGEAFQTWLRAWLEEQLKSADPDTPIMLAAHATVEGAVYGNERSVMLGKDLVIPADLAAHPGLDYTALGHIHKPQDLNPDGHPPVVYPGSIERVDFGEARDPKYYLIAEIERGKTELRWEELENLRPYLDCRLELTSKENLTGQILEAVPPPEEVAGAIARLVLEYPRIWDPLIEEGPILDHFQEAFEFHLVRQPITEKRIRLPDDQLAGSLSPLELLDHYWQASQAPEDEIAALNQLAREIIHREEGEDG
jgi:exonuclease SbcD